LSGFTDHYAKLIVGTNLGGLGTLIASMASLISYKFVSKEESGIKGKYLLYFTVVNICFLVPLVLLYIII
jgi:Na+/H+ antiporter NhaD/arsenite permease-like protein